MECAKRGYRFRTEFRHSYILRLRSNGLGKLEYQSGVINVTDMTPTMLGILLRYMYTAKWGAALDSDSLPEIIYGAQKYELNESKHYCFCETNERFCNRHNHVRQQYPSQEFRNSQHLPVQFQFIPRFQSCHKCVQETGLQPRFQGIQSRIFYASRPLDHFPRFEVQASK